VYFFAKGSTINDVTALWGVGIKDFLIAVTDDLVIKTMMGHNCLKLHEVFYGRAQYCKLDLMSILMTSNLMMGAASLIVS
jgi:hypothetical protein